MVLLGVVGCLHTAHVRILCFGDIHGRIYHLIRIAHDLSVDLNPDLILQVGDLGYFTDRGQLDQATLRFAQDDASELHTLSYLGGAWQASRLSEVAGSGFRIGFIRGNHECQELLHSYVRPVAPSEDRSGILCYYPDGTIVEHSGFRIAFLGGVETATPDSTSISAAAFEALARESFDMLVTHDGPFGIAIGFTGKVQGSRLITDLIHRARPRFHIFGHYHVASGPYRIGETISLGLASLIAPTRRNPEIDINPGSAGIVDLQNRTVEVRTLEEFWHLKRDTSVEDLLDLM